MSYTSHIYARPPARHSHSGSDGTSDLSIWLSVDPMADKYPGVSPYTYCGDNPVRLVDPNGEFPIETIWDLANVVYDVGAAVVNHIKGDHTRAKEHWVDAAADVAAVFIPYVPAGATKAIGLTVKGFKTIDKVSAGGKTYSNIADFYKCVKNLPTGERVAKFKEVGGQVAKQNGWEKMQLYQKRMGMISIQTESQVRIILLTPNMANLKCWIKKENTKVLLLSMENL